MTRGASTGDQRPPFEPCLRAGLVSVPVAFATKSKKSWIERALSRKRRAS
jgi:hypothetical protein